MISRSFALCITYILHSYNSSVIRLCWLENPYCGWFYYQLNHMYWVITPLRVRYWILHKQWCNNMYWVITPLRVRYWILHKRWCNNVSIITEAILCMHKTCYCTMLLKSPGGWSKSIESWSKQNSSSYTGLMSLKKAARLPKRRLSLSLKKVASQMYQPKR